METSSNTKALDEMVERINEHQKPFRRITKREIAVFLPKNWISSGVAVSPQKQLRFLPADKNYVI